MIRMTLAEARRLGMKIAAATPLRAGRQAVASRRQRRMPEDVLWQAVVAAYPEACREYVGAVPSRRYRIDVALVEERIAVECDGWQYHGKFQQAHQTDRERQNLLAIHGWLVLRFTHGQIFKDLFGVCATIDAAVRQRRAAC